MRRTRRRLGLEGERGLDPKPRVTGLSEGLLQYVFVARCLIRTSERTGSDKRAPGQRQNPERSRFYYGARQRLAVGFNGSQRLGYAPACIYNNVSYNMRILASAFLSCYCCCCCVAPVTSSLLILALVLQTPTPGIRLQ